MTTLFFSYSHKDEVLRNQLETQLTMLRRQGLIEAWHDRRITAGSEVHDEISAHLEEAGIILLLVSPDFLASDYCYEREMMRAMERHTKGEARVIPVILRPCDWHGAPFGSLMATPKDGTPVTSWPDRDEALLDVVQSIKRALPGPRKPSPPPAPPPVQTASRAVETQDIRSSNLQVPRRLTERDRDAFLHESFEYVAKFFHNTLDELHRRNEDIDVNFRQVDANRFEAAIYRGGRSAAQCAVFLDSSFSSGISYSEGPRFGGINEQLGVSKDEHTFFLTPLLNPTGHNRKQKLSMQGGAEHLWARFIAPLQRE